MKFHQRKISLARHHGSVLIITTIVLLAMTAMILALGRSMATDALVSANRAAEMQAGQIELGAEQYAIGLLAQNGVAALDQDVSFFQQVQLGDGYFWLLRPHYDSDPTLPAFGLVDESSKININGSIATVATLQQLPNMTADIAASVVAWHKSGNPDTSFYESLTDAYQPKGSAYETVEEILLVKDVTPDLLWGDGTAAPLGAASGSAMGASIQPGAYSAEELSAGWKDLLTVYSANSNNTPSGTSKLRINTATLPQIESVFATPLGSDAPPIIAKTIQRRPFKNIYDFAYRTGLNLDQINMLADLITVAPTAGSIAAPINVNTAPAEVLACLQGLSASDIQSIISARQTANADNTISDVSWFVQTVGDLQKLAALGGGGTGDPITGSPSRYSADILAVSANGRAFKRVKIVIDPSTTPPTVIYRRDLSDKGWPMDKSVLQSLRSGQMPAAGAVSGLNGGGL